MVFGFRWEWFLVGSIQNCYGTCLSHCWWQGLRPDIHYRLMFQYLFWIMSILSPFCPSSHTNYYLGYMYMYPWLVASRLCENFWGMGVHNVLSHNALHLTLVLDISLCTHMLFGWSECWNICVCSGMKLCHSLYHQWLG